MFKSDNGVFSKNKVDYASLFLVKTFLASEKDVFSILDVGCGYGFIGIVLSKVLNKHVDMVDINKRAIHLCEMNIKDNEVDATCTLSDIYDNVKNKYDLIITNPPIRAGKQVVLAILKDAQKHLNPEGELWAVIRTDGGVKSIIKELSSTYKIEIKEKSKGFYIFLAKSN